MSTTHAAAAKAIRQDLKKAFPSVTFKVTGKAFSMGDAVDVRWVDGPTSDDVNALIRKYRYGHFDGSIDCYEMSNKRRDIPQVKYVQTDRLTSEEVIAA